MNSLKILIPADFSDSTTYATNYAKNFTSSFAVDITFLHVLEINAFVEVNDTGGFEEMMGINSEQIEIQKKEAIQDLASLVEKHKGDFNCIRSIIKYGPLTETILNYASESEYEMIVMGTSGSQGFKEWISGSETQIIARRSEVPVLTLMCDRKHEPIDNVLFISDFSHEEAIPDPVIQKLLVGCKAKLHLLQITDDAESVKQDLENMVNYVANRDFEEVELHVHHNKKVLDGINEFEKMEEMNIIVIGTHGRRGLRSLIKGSIAEKLVNHLYKPVLVFKI